MNVGELLDSLAGLPPETKLYMASDAEGNAIHELEQVAYPGNNAKLEGKADPLVLWPRHDHLEFEE